MKKSFSTIMEFIRSIAIAVLLVPMLALSAEKITAADGSGLVTATWAALAGGGTVSVGSGTNTVTGTSTTFQTDLDVGSIFWIGATNLGTVASITDQTHLTLTVPSGSTYTDQAYSHQSLPKTVDNVTIAHDVYINDYSGFTVNNLTIVSGGILTSNCEPMNLTGNLVIDGSFVQNAPCKIVMTGATATIDGTAAPLTLLNLRISQHGLVTLNKNVTVSGDLDLDDGTIDLGTRALTLGLNAATPGTLTTHVGTAANIDGIGTFTRWFNAGAVTLGNNMGLFPVARGTANRNVWIGGLFTAGGTVSVSQTELSGTTAFDASFVEHTYTFDKRTDMRWTVLHANGLVADNTPGVGMSMRIQASGVPGVNALADLTMSFMSGPASGTWAVTTGDLANPQVNRLFADETLFDGQYHIASTANSPMPVELSLFTAAAKGRAIVLQWKTATEKNNYGFEIERRAINAGDATRSAPWSKIGFAEGHGTTSTAQSYTYTDATVGGTYAYRLKQIDRDGSFEYSASVEATSAMTAADYGLAQNYPNPFNPTTSIHFTLPSTQHAALIVSDALGRHVKTLFDGEAEGGVVQTVVFDASGLASGMYFYTLRSNGKTDVRKMQLLR